jgi:predicted transcriptional regulator
VSVCVGLNLTHSEDEVIKILLENPNSTAESISNELSLSKRTIERILSSLQVKGVIERIGSKKMGRWKVIK